MAVHIPARTLYQPGIQPKVPAKIDWANPLTRGLLFFAYGNYNYVDGTWAIHTTNGTDPSTAPLGTYPGGYALKTNAGTFDGWYFNAPSIAGLADTNQHTLGGHVSVSSPNTYGHAFLVPVNPTAADPYGSLALGRLNNETYYYSYYAPSATAGSTVTYNFTNSTYDDSRHKVVMTTRDGSSNARMYENGALIQTVTPPASSNIYVGINEFWVLSRNGSAINNFGTAGRSGWQAVWNRSLSPPEAISISKDPFQILKLLVPRYTGDLVTATLYYLRPDADISDGSWVNQAGSNVNLYQSIDEVSPSDSDYIISSYNPSTDICRVGLENPLGTVDTAKTVAVRYRYKKQGVDTIDLVVRLKENGTTRATWTHNGITSSYVTAAQVLSAGEKSSITNWDNLELEFQANKP